MLRAVLFLRVSTRDQTVANQLPDLIRLAKERRWTVVERIEETASGAAADRAGLARLFSLVYSRAVDVVAVWALDRLGRSMSETVRTVLELERAGVDLVSVKEPWLSVKGPVRSLLVSIFSWVAEVERARLIERTNAGLDRARARGAKLGRPRRTSARDRGKIAKLAADFSVRQIAARLKIPASTVHRAILRHRLNEIGAVVATVAAARASKRRPKKGALAPSRKTRAI